MYSFAFILCSTLLLTSAFPQKTSRAPSPTPEEADSYDVVIKKIMSAVMQDVFGGKSMPESMVKRTMEELEKHDGDVAHIIHLALERVQDIQNGEGYDVVAAKVFRALITKFGERIKAIENIYDYLGKENVDELIGKLALKGEELIRKKFGKKAVEESAKEIEKEE